MECKKDENNKHCTCEHQACPRHGICCDCVAYHKKMGGLPACLK